MITTVENVKRDLQSMNRDYQGFKTWESLYGNISLNEQKAIDEQTVDYSKDIAQAYASSLQNQNLIQNSNLLQGYKEQELASNQQALEDAFAQYQANYLSNVSNIQTNAAKATQQVDTALTNMATNYNKLNNLTYDYLVANDRSDIAGYDKYYTTDEVGNKILKSWKQIQTEGLDDADWYDKIFNDVWTKDERGNAIKRQTFQDYLEEQEETDMLDFLRSSNLYDYTQAGTNFRTFKKMMGLDSLDEQYTYIDRLTGMSKDEFDSIFKSLDDPSDYKTAKEAKKDFESMITTLEEGFEKVGIDDNELTEQLANLKTSILNLDNYKKADSKGISRIWNYTKDFASALGVSVAGNMIGIPAKLLGWDKDANILQASMKAAEEKLSADEYDAEARNEAVKDVQENFIKLYGNILAGLEYIRTNNKT